jgi:hypothetical protein
VTSGASPPKASQAAVAGSAVAAVVVVAVRPAAAAGTVAVAAPGAAVEAATVEAVAETAASPLASPMAAGDAAVSVEPGSYSAPPTKDPSPRRRLRDLSSSRSWLLHEVAASSAFFFPEGAGPPWLDPPGLGSARWWLSGEVPGIRIPLLGSPLTCQTARPPSSRVGSDALTAVRIAWSSYKALIPLGSTSSSGAYALPVIARIRTSSSTLDRSEPAPCMILLQSFTPVNMQAILDHCCRGAMRRLRKSPSTIINIRPPLARVWTRSSTRSSSAGRDGLAFQLLRSRRGPSVGSSRRSLASVMAMT